MSPKEIIELVVLSVVVLALVVYYSIKAVKNGWVKKCLADTRNAISISNFNTTNATSH